MSAALRQALRVVQQEAPQLANLRSVRTSAAPKGYHYDYEHGPHYLDFHNWPGRRTKVAAWIIGIITTGVGVPSFAVWWHQSKARGS